MISPNEKPHLKMSTAETISAELATEPAEEVRRQGQPVHRVITITPSNYFAYQGCSSRVIALGLLVFTLPIIALLYFLVRITSRGPGFYRQVRVGKDGRIFVMYKIRSMVVNAEANTGPVWTQTNNDPRITRVGWFLRKSHLDELPQLINVVRGEMALFGPRPERPELVHVLAEGISGYWDRLAVLPGITGLAQINLPPDADIECVRRKLVLDLEYIRTANLWMDVRMFLWTGLRLIATPASIATRLTGLGRNVRPVMVIPRGPVSLADVVQEQVRAKSTPQSAR